MDMLNPESWLEKLPRAAKYLNAASLLCSLTMMGMEFLRNEDLIPLVGAVRNAFFLTGSLLTGMDVIGVIGLNMVGYSTGESWNFESDRVKNLAIFITNLFVNNLI